MSQTISRLWRNNYYLKFVNEKRQFNMKYKLISSIYQTQWCGWGNTIYNIWSSYRVRLTKKSNLCKKYNPFTFLSLLTVTLSLWPRNLLSSELALIVVTLTGTLSSSVINTGVGWWYNATVLITYWAKVSPQALFRVTSTLVLSRVSQTSVKSAKGWEEKGSNDHRDQRHALLWVRRCVCWNWSKRHTECSAQTRSEAGYVGIHFPLTPGTPRVLATQQPLGWQWKIQGNCSARKHPRRQGHSQ